MKITRVVSILSLFFVLFAGSCTIEKRVHLKGYHIEWKGRNTTSSNPILVKKEKIKHDHQVVELSDSVGILIKSAIAEANEQNQDSVLELIGTLMRASTEVNTLQASVSSKMIQRKSAPNSFSSEFSRQFELMKRSGIVESSSYANDSTDTSPDYVEPEKTKSKSKLSKSQKLGLWSIICLGSPLVLLYLGVVGFVLVPFVAIPGIVQSSKEINTPGNDQESEIIRSKGYKGKTMSILALAVWGFVVLVATSIYVYSEVPY